MPNPASSSGVFATLEQILPAVWRARIARYAPFLLLLGLLVFCGYLAARLSWQFAAPAPVGTPALAGGNAGSANAAGVGTPGEKIVAAHLFGTSAVPAADAAARNAPETSLDLALVGVAADSNDARSYAIITNGSSRDGNTYPVGSTLPGGALIRQILPDRVIIAHQGRLETLRLPTAGTSILAAPADFGADTPAQTGQQAAPFIPPDVRREIEQHPKSLSDYMRMRPYSVKGQVQGYRVYPGKNPELFRKAGLLPGDIVTSVNGVTLDNPVNTVKAMGELRKAQGPVRLGVLRQGHETSVTINPGG
ncbi:MAG: type II secretion system protein GspC [Gammaproteobacteria bacterium]